VSGKGSKPRPLSVPRKQFDENWERIFGKKKAKKNKEAKKPTHSVRLEYGIQVGDWMVYQIRANSNAEAIDKAIAKHRKIFPWHSKEMLKSNAYPQKIKKVK
jgi:hypothetical protein